jgi:hypothetical protein
MGGDHRQIKTCRKVPLQVNLFRGRHFALLAISLERGGPLLTVEMEGKRASKRTNERGPFCGWFVGFVC